MASNTRPKVVIVGSGIAGLVAGLELADKGWAVSLFEKADQLGGKIHQVEIDGKKLDGGPTVLTMRWILEQIFQDVGATLSEHMTLTPSRVIARHAWDDGTRLDLENDSTLSLEAISAFAGPNNAAGYGRFIRDTRTICEHAYRTFLVAKGPSVREMAATSGASGLKSFLKIDPFRSMNRALESYFTDPRLRQLFGRYATYFGSSPYRAPATLNLIAHVEQQGVWIPEGGMFSLVTVLAELARSRGVELNVGRGVAEITVGNGLATGVVLDDGKRLTADAVVYNGDVSALGAGKMGTTLRRIAPSTRLKHRSLSALTVAMLAKTDGFPLLEHNVFFSSCPYRQEFIDIFKRRQLPSRPTVYIRAPDRDGGAIPSGRERLFFIINAPAVDASHSVTDEEITSCLDAAFHHLSRCGLRVERNPDRTRITSPVQWASRFPETGGAIYGTATHSPWASMKRAGVRSRLPGLYLAGGSVHPGAGVPMAALSGRQAAAALLEDHSSTGLSPPTGMPGGMSTA